MPEALVADEMDLGKAFTSVGAAMICTLLTEKGVIGLPLSILCGNTVEESVNMAQNDIPRNIGEERQWYPLRRTDSVLCRHLETQTTPPMGHPALPSAHEPILVVTMGGVAVTFKSLIDKMTYGAIVKVINLSNAENGNLFCEDLNTTIDKLENRCNTHRVPI